MQVCNCQILTLYKGQFSGMISYIKAQPSIQLQILDAKVHSGPYSFSPKETQARQNLPLYQIYFPLSLFLSLLYYFSLIHTHSPLLDPKTHNPPTPIDLPFFPIERETNNLEKVKED